MPTLIPRWIAAAFARPRPEIAEYGDVARIPQELATGGERFAGGRAAKATRRITRTQNHGSHSMTGGK